MRRALEHQLGRHNQDAHGGDGVPDLGAADKLKLGKLAPAGFSVRSSKKLITDDADVAVAEVDGPDGPQVRVGLITAESGKWDAGFTGEDRKARLREQIAQKQALFESEDEQPDSLEDEISELERELEDLDNERTAIVAPEAMANLRRQLGEAAVLAKANKAKQDATLKALTALDEQRNDIIREFSGAALERDIRRAQSNVWSRKYRLRLLRQDPKFADRIPEAETDVAEAELQLEPLLARRAELMPPDARARLEDLERQTLALNEDAIDVILASADATAPGGARIVAEVWGSDDVDSDWVTTRLYVLGAGETTEDADNGDGYAYFRGLKGLNGLLRGLGGLAGEGTPDQQSFRLDSVAALFRPISPAVHLMLTARALEASDVVMRDGKAIKVTRDSKGQFASKAGGAVKSAAGAVSKALLSGDAKALDGFNREQLRREAGKRGITLTRGASIDVIRDALWDHERSGVDDEDDLPGVEKIRLDLSRMTLPQLKERAKADGLKGYSKMRKAELVDGLTNAAVSDGDAMARPELTSPKYQTVGNIHLDKLREFSTREEGAEYLASILPGSRQAITEDLGFKRSGRTHKTSDLILDAVFGASSSSPRARGKANVADVMAAIAPMEADPKSGDRERVAELLAPLTVSQLNEVAAAHGIDYLYGSKDRRQKDLLHGLVGHKLDTRSIIGGGWNKSIVPERTPAGNSPDAAALTRRIKQIDEAMDEVDGRAAQRLNATRKQLVEQRNALSPPQPTTPSRSSKPLLSNTWGGSTGGDPSAIHFHDDGEIGTAINRMGDDRHLEVDGDALGNVLGHIATDAVLGRSTAQQQLDRLKQLRDRMPEGSKARRELDFAVRDLDAPNTPAPKVPDAALPPLRQLMADLHAVPMARREPGKELDALAQILDDFDKGKTGGMRMVQAVQALRNRRHESKEGKFEIDRAVDLAVQQLEQMQKADRRSLYPPT